MVRSIFGFLSGLAIIAAVAQTGSTGPYKVLKTVRVGGLGGFDYIQADPAGRRLYIPRGAVQGDQPLPGRITIFDLDELSPVSEIPNTRANGAAVDVKSGHDSRAATPDPD